MSPRAGSAGPTLAFVESPVQLLNVLEWAHTQGLSRGREPAAGSQEGPAAGAASGADLIPPQTRRGVRLGAPGRADTDGSDGSDGPVGARGPVDVSGAVGSAGAVGLAGTDVSGSAGLAGADGRLGTSGSAGASGSAGTPGTVASPGASDPVGSGAVASPGGPGLVGSPGPLGTPGASGPGLTLVVLSPTDPMSRGQLRRMAELARDEGYEVRWEEARGGVAAPFQTIGGLTSLLRRAARVVMGDPFSRYVQLLLTITKARDLVVVDDGTATMEFVAQLARGERLVRWHRKGGRPGPRDLVFAPVSAAARRRLTPNGGRGSRSVEVFSSMPIDETPDGVTVTVNGFDWTRSRFGPPRITTGADLVGTSLVETGVVDGERYLDAVRLLAKTHGARRYFAHRRESAEKLHRLAAETGLQIVRPDLPLELIARRGPIGRMILSFPSTVVHTLPLALAGTDVRVAVCDIDPAWLTANASPRAQGFLSGVTGTARDVQRLARSSVQTG